MLKEKENPKKSPKPTEYDIHIKYRCPQCQQDHWLSYQQASTKGFKTVCFCEHVFQVKRPTGFSLKYEIATPAPPTPPKDKPVLISELSIDILNKAIGLLVGYGFTKEEANTLLTNSYISNPVNDYSILVKQTLESIRK